MKIFFIILLSTFSLLSKENNHQYSLYINVENVYPESIHYFVDGKEFKNGSLLNSGKHEIKVSKWGFIPFVDEVKLEKNKQIDIRLKMKKY
jgi:hypothetical protein